MGISGILAIIPGPRVAIPSRSGFGLIAMTTGACAGRWRSLIVLRCPSPPSPPQTQAAVSGSIRAVRSAHRFRTSDHNANHHEKARRERIIGGLVRGAAMERQGDRLAVPLTYSGAHVNRCAQDDCRARPSLEPPPPCAGSCEE